MMSFSGDARNIIGIPYKEDLNERNFYSTGLKEKFSALFLWNIFSTK